MTRILGRADVESVLTLDDCIAAVEEAFREYGEERIAPPQSLGVPLAAGAFHIKTAVTDLFAAKINANFPGNPSRHGLPAIQGVILLVDHERGVPLAILDSTLITTLRTAAASAVAARYLARADAAAMTVIGCGNQGRAHLEAMSRVRPIARVFAYDCDPESSSRFVREMSGRVSARIEAVSAIDDAVARSDIVVTCTPARSPVLHARHARPGLFIAAVGADNPDKQEIDPELMARLRVVPDVTAQAAVLGDLHHAIAAGVMTARSVHAELGRIVSGKAPARRNDRESFLFDSTGTALQDAAAAKIAFVRAEERGLGLVVRLF